MNVVKLTYAYSNESFFSNTVSNDFVISTTNNNRIWIGPSNAENHIRVSSTETLFSSNVTIDGQLNVTGTISTFPEISNQAYITIPDDIDTFSNNIFTYTNDISNAIYTSNVMIIEKDEPTVYSSIRINYSNTYYYDPFTIEASTSNQAFILLPAEIDTLSNDLYTEADAISNQAYITVPGFVDTLSNDLYTEADAISNQTYVTVPDSVNILSNDLHTEADAISNQAYMTVPDTVDTLSNDLYIEADAISNQTYVTVPDSVDTLSNDLYTEADVISNQSYITVPNDIDTLSNDLYTEAYAISNHAYITVPDSVDTLSNDLYTEADAISNQAYVTVPGDVDTLSNDLYVKISNDSYLNNHITSDGSAITVSASASTFQSNVTIQGNLVVNGTEFIANAQTIEIEDNTLLLNKGEVGAGVSSGTAGLIIDRGSSTNFEVVFDESDDKLKIGETGSLFAVATESLVDTLSNDLYTESDAISNQAYITVPDSIDTLSNDLYTEADAISNQAYITVPSDIDTLSNDLYTEADVISNQAYITMPGDIDTLSNDLYTEADTISNQAYITMPGDIDTLSNDLYTEADAISNQAYITVPDSVDTLSNDLYTESDMISNQAYITVPGDIDTLSNDLYTEADAISNQAYTTVPDSVDTLSNDIYTEAYAISNQAYMTVPDSVDTLSNDLYTEADSISNQSYITVPGDIDTLSNDLYVRGNSISNQAYVSVPDSVNTLSNDLYTEVDTVSNQCYVTVPADITALSNDFTTYYTMFLDGTLFTIKELSNDLYTSLDVIPTTLYSPVSNQLYVSVDTELDIVSNESYVSNANELNTMSNDLFVYVDAFEYDTLSNNLYTSNTSDFNDASNQVYVSLMDDIDTICNTAVTTESLVGDLSNAIYVRQAIVINEQRKLFAEIDSISNDLVSHDTKEGEIDTSAVGLITGIDTKHNAVSNQVYTNTSYATSETNLSNALYAIDYDTLSNDVYQYVPSAPLSNQIYITLPDEISNLSNLHSSNLTEGIISNNLLPPTFTYISSNLRTMVTKQWALTSTLDDTYDGIAYHAYGYDGSGAIDITSSNGIITGIESNAGTYTFNVRAGWPFGISDEQTATLDVKTINRDTIFGEEIDLVAQYLLSDGTSNYYYGVNGAVVQSNDNSNYIDLDGSILGQSSNYMMMYDGGSRLVGYLLDSNGAMDYVYYWTASNLGQGILVDEESNLYNDEASNFIDVASKTSVRNKIIPMGGYADYRLGSSKYFEITPTNSDLDGMFSESGWSYGFVLEDQWLGQGWANQLMSIVDNGVYYTLGGFANGTGAAVTQSYIGYGNGQSTSSTLGASWAITTSNYVIGDVGDLVVVTFDGTDVKMYVEGTLIYNKSENTSFGDYPTTTTNPVIRFGHHNSANRLEDGIPTNSNEVAPWYARLSGLFLANGTAFNDTAVSDLVTNKNDMTLADNYSNLTTYITFSTSDHTIVKGNVTLDVDYITY